MSNYNIVSLMNPAKPQANGDITVASPGGHNTVSYGTTDNVSGSGAAHKPLPTGQNIANANSHWGSTSGQIASYPTYYEGSNTAIPVASTPIG